MLAARSKGAGGGEGRTYGASWSERLERDKDGAGLRFSDHPR